MRATRSWVIPLIPLAVIWFPEMAAQISKEKVSTQTASRLGWAALILLTMFPLLIRLFGER